MASGRISYAIKVSFCRYWVWIVGPTMVWGLFPLFYAGLPESIRGDLTLPAYGMLMVTRAVIAAIFFAVAGFIKWRSLNTDGKTVLTTFFAQEKLILLLAVGVGLVLCRLFESFIFSAGEFAFGLIFCVALTPFAERILSVLYVRFGKKKDCSTSSLGRLCSDLRTTCVEWPTPTTRTHTWLRLVLLSLVIVCFLYAKQGFILRNPVDSQAISTEMLNDETVALNWTLKTNPWTGEALTESNESEVLLIVKPTVQRAETFLTGYGWLLVLALLSALSLQAYYHILDVLGSRFSKVADIIPAQDRECVQLTKVYIQQATIWTLAGLIWSAVWLFEPRNGLALLGDLTRSPMGMLAWIGGVGLLGTVLCYFADNFGIDRYSKWAELRELPVSASRWAGIATTVDPVISLLLISISSIWLGNALHEHVAVPWMALVAALAMSLVFAARFQETATEVYQRTIDRALRKRMQPSVATEHAALPLPIEDEAQNIAEFMALAVDGSCYADEKIELAKPEIVRKRMCGASGGRCGQNDAVDVFLDKLYNRLLSHSKFFSMATIVRLAPLGIIMCGESERIDKLRLFLLDRLRKRFEPLGASILELDDALDLAGYVSAIERERIRSAIHSSEDGWDLILITSTDWSNIKESINADLAEAIENAAKVLLRILQGQAHIALIGDATDISLAGIGHLSNVTSLEALSEGPETYDLALISSRSERSARQSSPVKDDTLPQIMLLRQAPTIAEREQITIPWVIITDDAWANRTAVAKAILDHLCKTNRHNQVAQVLVVEDNSRDFYSVATALKEMLGVDTNVIRYQPASARINDYRSVLTDIRAHLDRTPVDALVFDIELVDEMFASMVEKISGVELAIDINTSLNDSTLIALLSRARVADLACAEDAGVLIASKTPGGYSRLADGIASQQPSLLISGLTAYAYSHSSENAALKRVLQTDKEPGADSILFDMERLLRYTLQELRSIRVLNLPEFSNKSRGEHE